MSVSPVFLIDLTALQNAGIIITTAGTLAYGFYQALKRAKKNAVDAAALAEEKIQKRLKEASDQDRENYDERIQRLRAIADEWKEIAQQRSLKIEDLIVKVEEKMSRISALETELKALELKYEQVLVVNTELVQRMTSLEKKVNA